MSRERNGSLLSIYIYLWPVGGVLPMTGGELIIVQEHAAGDRQAHGLEFNLCHFR